MKKLSGFLMLLAVALIACPRASAQDATFYLTLTKSHWNWNLETGTNERWLELEKMWHDNVTMKNEHIVGSGTYLHLYTGDNSEVQFATVFPSWEAIEKAGARNEELSKAAWPDEAERDAMNKERNSYYAAKHSDEIYASTGEFNKPIPNAQEASLVWLIVDRHLAFPDDAVDGEFSALMKEFTENVTHKNPHLQGYYVWRHAWGSDGRDMMEAYVIKSTDDLDDMQEAMQPLIEAYWPDEAKRKEFFDKFNKYWTPWHSDRLYEDVPELNKILQPAADAGK